MTSDSYLSKMMKLGTEYAKTDKGRVDRLFEILFCIRRDPETPASIKHRIEQTFAELGWHYVSGGPAGGE